VRTSESENETRMKTRGRGGGWYREEASKLLMPDLMPEKGRGEIKK
jgi:hypothetical protein